MTMDRPSSTVWNVPNQITALRLVLAIVVFVLIPLEKYLLAMVLFSIAAATDWVDGYWARKYNQVTRLGRVFDPFVDKVIICGTYILLAADSNQQQFGLWGIVGWMAVVVAARELLVTVIRSQIERDGGDFSAKWAGKWKMVFQCGAVIATLLALHLTHTSRQPMQDLADWLKWSMAGFVWLSVASTIYSGAVYVQAAGRLMRAPPDDDSSESP
ncbi:MAG: CDP-diacylglycerol--glycerol-3-phosphate 3-phosphatidyltransferase [Pirellulaceae bacterium]